MTLKTIEEYNKEKLDCHNMKNNTGIACPDCGFELQFTEMNVMLLTNPPQRTVNCSHCGYYRNVYV